MPRPGRARRPRGARARPLLLALLVAGLVALSGFVGYRLGGRGLRGYLGGLGACRALVIDQLGIDYPNPELLGEVAEELGRAGCSVTVLEGGAFRVSSLGILKYYDVVIFRGHTGWANIYNPATGEFKVYVALFTGEEYKPGLYPELARRGYIARGIPLVKPSPEYNRSYVALTQYYLRDKLEVKEGAVFILSTCFAGAPELARILVGKGAGLVVSWDGNVTVPHADEALLKLVELYARTHSWSRALEELPSEYRVDPVTGSKLVSWTPRGLAP